MIIQGSIVLDKGAVYTEELYEMEVETSKMVVRHLQDNLPVYHVEKLIQEAQAVFGITLSASQVQAVQMVFSNPLSIITGGPGTGKTTVLKSSCMYTRSWRIMGFS